jgi:Domain of unknown function (DUF3883)
MRDHSSHKAALVKIAPGHRAEYWPDCLREGYICVGWDDVGDLREYGSESDFRAVFEKHYKYQGNLSATRRKANELWTLTKLRAGDRIVANKGMSKVLAIGVVQEPGYEWRPNRTRGKYFHTVRVVWDPSLRKSIPRQPWRQTVAEVPYGLFKTIAGSAAPPRRLIRLLNDPQPEGDGWHWTTTSATARLEAKASKEGGEEIERAAGFQSDKRIRKVVERHAMDAASAWFRKKGYEVKDVSSGRPYDLLCTKGPEVKYVEVKGTQERGQAVVLTAGEVTFINNHKHQCALCVVHDIAVANSRKPKASGGQISFDSPFDLSAGVLSPINYIYNRSH